MAKDFNIIKADEKIITEVKKGKIYKEKRNNGFVSKGEGHKIVLTKLEYMKNLHKLKYIDAYEEKPAKKPIAKPKEEKPAAKYKKKDKE